VRLVKCGFQSKHSFSLFNDYSYNYSLFFFFPGALVEEVVFKATGGRCRSSVKHDYPQSVPFLKGKISINFVLEGSEGDKNRSPTKALIH